MLKTIDGKTLMMVMKEIEACEPFLTGTLDHYAFKLDGSSSSWKGHDGENIDVCVDDIWIRMEGGGHLIKIPNYDHGTLPFMIENVAELLWFEWDMN